jgi:UDP-N-acetylmuramoyl-L-alanyl-D-glutamate--2,6-diaminopimelate ligase
MKRLENIIKGIELLKLIGESDRMVSGLSFHADTVEKDNAFFAVKGTQVDGHEFIDIAVRNGAAVVFVSDLPEHPVASVTYIQVKDVRQCIGFAASNFYDNPSSKLNLIGVTGTNGKSTIVSMMFQFFTQLEYKCGLFSTIENRIGEEVYPSKLTTPDPISLNQFLAEMVAKDCDYAFMEVSSIAVHQGRINGLTFAGGIFTNITHDHLDYHGTFAEYLRCKKLWFDEMPSSAFVLVNSADKNSKVMVQNTKASRYTYGLQHPADFRIRIIESDMNGMMLKIDGEDVWIGLVGEYNAENLAAVYGVAFLMGIPKDIMLSGLSLIKGPRGRFERISGPNNVMGIVDYAHTPDALSHLLESIRKISMGSASIISVVGCGGDRDKSKRSLMGKIAASLSHRVIFTSDNPRSEDPQEIVNQMMEGVSASDYKKCLQVPDREQAIRTAVALAAKGDLIVVAGKGHETYQEIKGKRLPFDDTQVLTNSFNQIKAN